MARRGAARLPPHYVRCLGTPVMQGARAGRQAAGGGRPQVGTDQFTEALPQHLRDTGCEMRLLRQVGGPTGTAVILLQPDGAPGTLGRFHQAERLRPWHGPLPRRWLHARHA